MANTIMKTRNARTSHEQLEILVHYLEEHQIMTGMKTHPLKMNEVKMLWEELSNILNRKKGAIKNVEEWKRFLVTWKSKTKAKARMLKKDQTGTGGGPATGTNLIDLEERLMVLIGWNTVESCNAVAQELPPEEIPVICYVEEVPRKGCTEALDNAAIIYKESSEQFLESARIIAASVEKLAIAFTTYAEATFAMAESKKQKYSNTCKNCRDSAN